MQTRHTTIELRRRLDVPPASVFAAFADDVLRRRWVRMPGRVSAIEHDFRIGGGERLAAEFTHPDGRVERLTSTLHYLAIESERRIAYAYHSVVDDIVRWASLVTVELEPDGDGTTLSWTEQVAFLESTGDGSADLPHLRGGIMLRLNGLAQLLGGAGDR